MPLSVMDFLRLPDLSGQSLLTTFILGLTVIALLLWHSSWKQNYWKRKGIPYAKAVPFMGSILENLKKPLHVVEEDRFKKLGRIYGHYECNRAVLSVAEPEILRNILVKDYYAFTGRRVLDTGDNITEKMLAMMRGEDWKRVRTIVSPTFSTGKIKRVMSIFVECSKTLEKNFRKASEKGEPIEAKSLYAAFTMDVIASSAFSTKIDSHNDPDNNFVTAAKLVFPKTISWRIVCYSLLPWFSKLFKISIFSPKALKFFSDTTRQIIEERQRTGQTRNDFLQLLMDTAKEADDDGKLDEHVKDDITENYGKTDSSHIFKNYSSKKKLTHEELVGQCVLFFIAGYDTTSSALSFASYALALNPDIQERVIEEVDEALMANKGELTYEAVQNMKYLDNVIAETLRLYSPAVRIERLADVDYKLGDTGLIVPKGMPITIPVYAIHRDPKLFPDPEKFDPERFSSVQRAKQVPYSYLPFGAGPRSCVAMRFALIEVKVCLAHVLSNFRIKKCPETKVPLDYHIGQGVLVPKDISLFMEIREDGVKSQ